MNYDENPLHFGVYRGLVIDTDPKSMKILLSVPELSGDQALGWAMPCVMFYTTTIYPPAPGTPVWVMFEHGDATKPIWLGTWRPT